MWERQCQFLDLGLLYPLSPLPGRLLSQIVQCQLGRKLHGVETLTSANVKGTWAQCISAKLVLCILHSQGPRRWGPCTYKRPHGTSMVSMLAKSWMCACDSGVFREVCVAGGWRGPGGLGWDGESDFHINLPQAPGPWWSHS